MYELTREEAKAMDGFRIHENLIELAAIAAEIAKEGESLVNELAAEEVRLVYAETKSDEWKGIKEKIILLKAAIKCNVIRKTLANKQATILQSARKPIE